MMAAPRGSSGGKIVLAACAVLLFCVFAALGTWQVKRLQWKLDLIERVNSRVNAAPVPAPGPQQWARVSAASDEYRRVRVSGKFLYQYTTRVQTTTARGIGFWLMTPLCTDDGIIFVNRGFVPMRSGDLDQPAPPSAGAEPCAGGFGPAAEVTGLLRLPEPKGRLLRENDPANERWYVRDVPAIAARRGLRNVAPYFVDAPAGQEYPMDASEKPVGGLTVIAFPNNHLVYALTWFALAAMVAGGYYLVLRYEKRRTRANDEAQRARDD
ncbi:SURF1 family protein [Massilia sp. YMA4]|uniref:SURF1 family protein n=1 Tax=Massilia sp. YMA4 TaxID=1593482 RepID=UPI000DD175C1|nr:SURF1 family protein [Massilia sp. YMA4]AXA90717.1 SURF1 family protein [Massilia sp. YMA4]